MDPPALLRSLYPSVVRILAPRASAPGYAAGSGVAIAADRVVTNCHVTRDAQAVQVWRGDQRWTATIQFVDSAHDVCLLEVPGLGSTAAKTGSSLDVKDGAPVYAVGFPGGRRLQLMTGQIEGAAARDGGRVLRTSSAFVSGASGGGLFDSGGRLLGLLTYRSRDGRAFYAIPVEWVLRIASQSPAEAWREIGPVRAEDPKPFWDCRVTPAAAADAAASGSHAVPACEPEGAR